MPSVITRENRKVGKGKDHSVHVWSGKCLHRATHLRYNWMESIHNYNFICHSAPVQIKISLEGALIHLYSWLFASFHVGITSISEFNGDTWQTGGNHSNIFDGNIRPLKFGWSASSPHLMSPTNFKERNKKHKEQQLSREWTGKGGKRRPSGGRGSLLIGGTTFILLERAAKIRGCIDLRDPRCLRSRTCIMRVRSVLLFVAFLGQFLRG